jgi:serine/threonine-protein kinase
VGVILLCGSLLLWNYFSGSTPGIADDIKGGGIVNVKDSTKPEIPGTKEKNSYIIENTLSNNTPVNNPRVDEEKKDDPNEKPGKKKESPPTKKKDGEKPDDKTDTPVEPEPEPIKDKKETPSESKGPVDVPAGREIYMTLAETISSEETGRDGSIVRLYASEDIRAGNRTIIKKGAAITGKIVDVIPSSTKRRKALIGFVVMKVEAVDGSTVKLHSERFRLFSDNAGSPAIYKQGQQFSAKLGRGRID